MQVFYPGRIRIWRVGYLGVRKPGEPAEKPSEQGENQQQTRLTYDAGPESNPGHIGGRRALWPLSHPCSPRVRTICHITGISF